MAVAILAIVLVPAMDALRTGVTGSAVHATQTQLHYHLSGRLEELLAEPFDALDQEALALGSPAVASATYSDPAGAANRRLVFLSRYDGDDINPSDGDPFTGVDEGLLWIRVEVEHTPLSIERLTDADE